MRRAVLVVALVVVLAATAVGVALTSREPERPCGAGVVSRSAGASTSVLAAEDAPEALVDAVEPLGEVLGSVGYDYEPPQLSSYETGVGVRVDDDPAFTLLDDATGAPRWSATVGTRRSTFDADAERYVVVTLPDDAAPEVVALDLATGERRWCAALPEEVPQDALVRTAVGPEGVAVLVAAGDEQVLRLLGPDGVAWEQPVRAGRGDFLGRLGEDLLLVGGSDLPDLLDRAALDATPAGARLAALDARAGEVAWTLEEPTGTDVRVAGVAPDRVVLTRAVAGAAQPDLVVLDGQGEEVWATTPARGTAFDATVRGDVVVVRAGGAWAAYDLRDGSRRWRFSVPERPQLLPYGATLDSMPSLDADRMLVGATEALLELDLRTGRRTPTPLPTDGLATTYWPVRIVASPSLLAVATNAGAVLVRR